MVMRRAISQTEWEPSGVAATGLQFRLNDQASLQGEMRLRGIGSTFAGATAEWTFGLAWRPTVF